MKRIFIGGLGRSGTTITLSALYHHHQVLAFPVETKFLVEEDGFAALTTALTTEFSVAGAQAAIDRFATLMRRHATGLDDSKFRQQHDLPIALFNRYDAAVDEFMSLVSLRCYFDDPAPLVAATRKFVDATFDDAARAHDYNVWVEKTPSNIWRIPFLRAHWPACHVIHCLRDPRDILVSLMQRKWLPSDVLQALPIFESMVAALLKVRRAHVNDPNWLELRLEDLVADTGTTLDLLARSVALEPFKPEANRSITDLISSYYAERSWPVVSLSKTERELIINWLHPAVVELGYPMEWSDAT